jgi:hypothetical protein
MKKYPLIGICIIAVVVLILASLSNVVGFQTVQSTNKKIINDEVDQKELLFQTIIDIANNKEIQKIALNSEIKRDGFFNSDMKFSVFTSQVLTKNQLKHMYLVGLMLSKIISKSKIHSMVEQYQLNNQAVQKEITAIIEKDATLKGEMTQLSNSKCDCDNENLNNWTHPILCALIYPLVFFVVFLFILGFALYFTHFLQYFYFQNILVIWTNIGASLNCFWTPHP